MQAKSAVRGIELNSPVGVGWVGLRAQKGKNDIIYYTHTYYYYYAIT